MAAQTNALDRYDVIVEVRKFNPYHDRIGRFTTPGGAASFTWKPGASADHDRAIQNEKLRTAGAKPSAKKPKRDFRAVDGDDVREMRREMGQDQDLSQEKVDQVMQHAGGGYFGTPNSFRINQALREDRYDRLSDDDRKTIKTLDQEMDPLTRDIKVTRLIEDGFFEQFNLDPSGGLDQKALDSLVGKAFHEKGYMSTSYDMDENVFHGRSITLNIDAPKGTKALIRPDMAEAEILLARDTHLEIKGVRKGPKDLWGDDTYIVDLEVIVD